MERASTFGKLAPVWRSRCLGGAARHVQLAARATVAGLFSLTGCGPAPEPVTPPAPTASVVAVAKPAPTVTPDTAPKDALPPLHPCVPEFIEKELHACIPGAGPADYNAVVSAMDAMTAAGPTGPRPKEAKPVPRALSSPEEKAATAARQFLCNRPAGEPGDDHTTSAFNLGSLYLRANHHEEATVFLRDVVLLDPQKHPEVEYAARFLLEAVRALGEARPECAATVAPMTEAVVAHVCKGPGAEQRAETCAALGPGK